jgi:hypothetical protein
VAVVAAAAAATASQEVQDIYGRPYADQAKAYATMTVDQHAIDPQNTVSAMM